MIAKAGANRDRKSDESRAKIYKERISTCSSLAEFISNVDYLSWISLDQVHGNLNKNCFLDIHLIMQALLMRFTQSPTFGF